MSRIGKHPVQIPAGTTVAKENDVLTVKGKLGELKIQIPEGVSVDVNAEEVVVKPLSESSQSRMRWGTMRARINNMVLGVSQGFTRKLELIGVGYKAQVQGKELKLSLGYSHDINYKLLEGVTAACPTPTAIELSGFDKQLLGQVASEIRSFRAPEPYKGKGVKYVEETINRKVGKKK